LRTEPKERPAALALLCYVSGLLAAPAIVSAEAAAAGVAIVALLVSMLRHRHSVRLTVMCLFVLCGLMLGIRHDGRRTAEDAALRALAPEAFATVRLQLEDGWAPRPDGSWRLKARRFELVGEAGRGFPIRRRIHVLLYDAPPDVERAGWLVARGFLRRLDGGACVLSVKSSQLATPEGEASRVDPRTWNRWLSSKLDEASANSHRARLGSALVQALVLGRGALVPWEVIDLYQRGGTYHLLVFSGVQIAMMAALLRWVLLRLGWRRASDAALLLVCILMPRFVGADPSVARSALMIGLLLGCWLWKRPTDAANLVFVSALVRLMLVPEDLTDPGFALTYSATAGIVVVGRSLAEGRGRLGRVLGYGIGAELGTTPFTLFFFNRVTIGGSLVTLVVSPVVTTMLALGFIAVALGPISAGACRFVLELVGSMNAVVLWVNRLVAEELRLSFVAAPPSVAALVSAVTIAVIASARGARRWGWIAALSLLAPFLSAGWNSLPDKSVEAAFHFLDVGQGDATLVLSRGHALLVDGGGSSTDPAFGVRTLIPLLAERKALRLDAVMLSHPHPDHCGGLVPVLRDLDVGRLIVARRHIATECGELLIDVAMRRHVPVEDAEASSSLRIGEIEVEAFSAAHRFRRAPENNSSLVVRMERGDRSVLLAGDIEKEAELVLLEQANDRLRADVLKVPHHGSRSSTTAGFVSVVSPRIAVVSSGRRNRFGHPHPEPITRLEQAGSRVEGTAASGSVEVSLFEGHLFVRRQFDSGEPGP